MTKVEVDEGSGSRVIFIAPEKNQLCELCGKEDELRPYGPDNKRICWDCAKLDKEGTSRRMHLFLFGDEPTPAALAKLIASMDKED